ncbi:MAG: hypothetical protein L3J43_05855 [Sulfurovum sp.]|nr:hypothetical protein [Sulfurovum sp.]
MIIELSVSAITPTLRKPSSPKDFERWDKEFTTYMKPYNDLGDELMTCKEYDFEGWMFMDVGILGDGKFYYFLDKAKKLNGHKFYFYPMLEKKENDCVNAYIMNGAQDFPSTYHCGKHLKYEAFPFVDSNVSYPIRVINKLELKTFKKIRDDRVYVHNDGFIISSILAKKFKKEKFTGYKLTPVKDCRGKKEHNNMHCLTATNILEPSEKNILRYEWQEKDEENKTLPYEGTLVYDEKSLQNIKSFNYPCEATKRDSTTDMIVNKEFKEFCEKEQIKGIDFIPIITKESELYGEYVQLVKSLCKDLIESNPKHRIGYSKIDPINILETL